MSDWQFFSHRGAALGVLLLAIPFAARAQTDSGKRKSPPRSQKGAAAPRVSLAPRFVPGETFHYDMENETTTETKRTGFASDPEGPSSLVVDWSAAVRIDVLPADAGTPGGVRLRSTYEKSTASIRSDTFDPAAAQTRDQYHQLEGKVVEFTLDAAGKVKYVSGIEGVVNSEKAAQSAREWIAQLGASAGAPPGGASIGQTWSSDQPADTLPIAGMVWHTDSQYLRNEPCHPPNPDLPAAGDISGAATSPATGATNTSVSANPPIDCAVILANLSLVRSKAAGHDPTPADLRQQGVESTGKWTGSGQSLLYVSLATGFVVSATQTGTQEMDITLTSNHRNTSMRYFGTISSRSQVSLVAGDTPQKQ